MKNVHHTWQKAASLYLAGLTSVQAMQVANVVNTTMCRKWLTSEYYTQRKNAVERNSNRKRGSRRGCRLLQKPAVIPPTGPLTNADRIAVRLEVIRKLLAAMNTPYSLTYETKTPIELDDIIANLRHRYSDIYGREYR